MLKLEPLRRLDMSKVRPRFLKQLKMQPRRNSRLVLERPILMMVPFGRTPLIAAKESSQRVVAYLVSITGLEKTNRSFSPRSKSKTEKQTS
jgi:hypothetical protein